MNISISSNPLGGLLGQTGGAAQMQPPPPPPQDSGWNPKSVTTAVASIDSDDSGGLSSSEIEESSLSKLVNAENWDSIDTDGNGEISAEELIALGGSQQGKESGPMGPPPGDRMGPPPGGGGQAPSEADPASVLVALLEEADLSNSTSVADVTDPYETILSLITETD